jgi:hypothetical protein
VSLVLRRLRLAVVAGDHSHQDGVQASMFLNANKKMRLIRSYLDGLGLFFSILSCALFRLKIPRATMIRQTRKRLAPAMTSIQVTGSPIAIFSSPLVFFD